MSDVPVVLLVDDEPNNLRALRLDLEDDYQTVSARDGVEAWEILEKAGHRFSVILLDRMMPRMNGMQLLEKLKAHPTLANIPVVMQSAAVEESQVAEGIRAGVYYYLTKPYDKTIMLSVLQAAIRDYRQYSALRQSLRQFRSKLNLVRQSMFEVKTFEEAEYLSTFLAQFFPDPERVVLGISELILNALEHGNLGITYEEKTELNRNKSWAAEIERRQALPENQGKRVAIEYVKADGFIQLTITDAGKGFDWQRYLDISPERATDNHGRGIALSKMISFDELTYVGCGNKVVCRVNTPAGASTSS